MRIAGKSLEISRDVRCLWRNPNAPESYSTAVSLHSHTNHSREGLDFIPRVLGRVPVVRTVLAQLEARHQRATGKPIPFDRAYWRPPLHPLAAHDLEASQVRNLLGLEPLVSLTDHDNLDACAELRAIGVEVPYSVEWTIPYHETVFHIGVHNLPPNHAREFGSAMAEITAAPVPERVSALLAELHAIDEVLLVLNHPFSCEGRVEQREHVRLLAQFLQEHGDKMDALELNGLQPAVNNVNTIRLAAERGYPVISGGDRHCSEPNANVNLTNARSFVEFVHEIRVEKRSSVLFLPQYRDPIPARYIEFIWHAVRNYPELEGRSRWIDRVYFHRDSGKTVTFGDLWPDGGPAVIRCFVSVIALLASPWMRAVLCTAIGRVGSLEPEVL